ncbi:MAG: alpha-2-macroglobulin family protein [Promethearchaeota archaeon]
MVTRGMDLDNFFDILGLLPDKKIRLILSRIKNVMTAQGRALTGLLKFDFNLNVTCIVASSLQALPGSLIHCLVFDRKYNPVPGADVSIMLPWGEELSTQTTGIHGSVVFNVPFTEKKGAGYLEVKVRKNNKVSFISNYYVNYNDNDKKFSKNLLLTAFMDLKQYRPGQDIHVRCILWRQDDVNRRPEENVTAYLSLIDPAGQEIVKQEKCSDEFGVFDCTFPTDEILPEGTYKLKISLPDYNYSVNRRFQVKDFKKPVIDLDVSVPGEITKGESLEIEGSAIYFYGGPLKDAILKILIINQGKRKLFSYEGNLVKGHFKIDVPTMDFPPGVHEVHVFIKDGVGRETEKDFQLLVKEERESGEELKYLEPEVITWDFTVEQVSTGKLLIKVSHAEKMPAWLNRPFYVHIRNMTGTLIQVTPCILNQDNNLLVTIPKDLMGLYLVELIKIGYNGSFQKKSRSVMLSSPFHSINLVIDAPQHARPGEEIKVGLEVLSRHKSHSIKLGCVLVDSSALAMSGGKIDEPFEDVELRSVLDEETLAKHFGNYQENVSELRGRLDTFLASSCKERTGIASLEELYYLIKYIEKSEVMFHSFIEYHLQNLYYTCRDADPAEFIAFIAALIKNNEVNYIRDIADAIFNNPRRWELLDSFMNFNDASDLDENELTLVKANIFKRIFELIRGTMLNRKTRDERVFPDIVDISSGKLKDMISRWSENLENAGLLISDFALKPESILHDDIRSMAGFKHPGFDPSIPFVITVNSDLVKIGFAGEHEPRAIFPTLVGYPKYASMMVDVGRGEPVKEEGPFKTPVEKKMTVRTNFVDTGYWNPRMLIQDGRVALDIKLPDTITKQEFFVVASTKDCSIGTGRASILVHQEFFIKADLPARLTFGDVIRVGAVITNLSNERFETEAILEVKNLILMDHPVLNVTIEPKSNKRISWLVQAAKVGTCQLKFTATCEKFKDVAIHEIYVHPDGDPIIKKTQGYFKSGENTFTITRSGKDIAHYAFFTVIPNMVHGALDGFESMLVYPHGCVEQTMGNVLSNLLVLEHLQATRKLTDKLKAKIEDFTVKGLQRLIQFRHVDDGGWGWWKNDSTSVYMTAYVLYGFSKAISLGFHVPQEIIDPAIKMIKGSQNEQGSWEPEQGLKWDKINSGMPLYPLVMTTFITQILLDILKDGENDPVIVNAVKYIKSNINHARGDPNCLSRIILLFKKINVDDVYFDTLISNLMECKDQAAWPAGSAMGGIVESSSLAIQALKATGDRHYDFLINQVLMEILKSRRPRGGWKTTSDTVAAVETFLLLDKGQDKDLNARLIINDFQQDLLMNDDNFDVARINLRNISLYKHLKAGDNKLVVEVKDGEHVFYQLSELIWTDKPESSNMNDFGIQRSYSRDSCSIGDVINVDVNIKAHSGISTFVVIEETLPSGFLLDVEGTKAMMQNSSEISSYNFKTDKLYLYPEDLEKFKFSYSMIATREFKGVHPATQVYAMYEPGVKAIGKSRKIRVEMQEKRGDYN